MTDAPIVQQPQTPESVYGYFVGNIDQPAIQRIANALTLTTSNGVKNMHLLFQTMEAMSVTAYAFTKCSKEAPFKFTCTTWETSHPLGWSRFSAPTRGFAPSRLHS